QPPGRAPSRGWCRLPELSPAERPAHSRPFRPPIGWETSMAAEYGAFERKVARMLSRFPLLKYWIKQGYARAAYALAKRGTAESTATFPVHEVGPPELETFFGYYDKSPLSGDGWLLCHASRGPSHKPPVPGLTAE